MPFCDNCGTDVGTSQFCPNCGKPQGKTQPYNANVNQQVPQNQNTQFHQSNNPYTNPNPTPTGFQNYQQSPPGGNQYYQQPPPRAYNSGQVVKPMGLTLLVIYEIILGALLIFIGLYVFSLSTSVAVQLADALGGTNYSGEFVIIGIIFMLWGVLGIIAGFFMNQWKGSGLTMSYIFLISTGILLFALYFIPLIAMIAFIYYFHSNQNFNNAFNSMRH